MTAIALAELIRVSRQAVSQYERGPETPAPDVMRRIAEVFGMPIHFFLRPIHARPDGTVFYRSMSTATKASRVRAESRFRWTREIVAFIRGFVNLPKVNFPDFALPRDPAEISPAMVEEAAKTTRRHWHLGDGPISNVVLLLENNGAVIVRHDLAADKLDAFSTWSAEERTPYVALNSAKNCAARSRFDVAHELGHLVLHRYVQPAAVARPEVFDMIEGQAHTFARAFLMPDRTFATDLVVPTLDAFRSMKPKWRVSIQSMIYRSRDLNLVSPDQEQKLWQNLARRGWRTKEPLDDTLEPEVPKLLRRSVELMVSSGATTRQDIVFQNALPPGEIEELIGLPTGFLSGPADEDDDYGGPSIIPFPAAG